MAANLRDNFSEKNKKLLRDRAGSLCSNPECEVVTQGAATAADKTASIGVAAHLTAAAPGGARYDASLSSEQRSSPDNGIWLCQSCSRLIDADPQRFPLTLLRQWKVEAEQKAEKRIGQKVTAPHSAKTPGLKLLPTQATEIFIGREEKISELLGELHRPEGSSHLLLSGLGGIGKTAICRKLAHLCANPNSNSGLAAGSASDHHPINGIVWLDAQTGLYNALLAAVQNPMAASLQISVEDPNWLNQLLAKLGQIAPPAVMFLDNLEADTDTDNAHSDANILEQLKQLGWHLLATSRSQLPQFGRIHRVDVLSLAQCTKLFLRHYLPGDLPNDLANDLPNDLPNGETTADDKTSLNALIELAGRHTLAVELLAKAGKDALLEIDEIYQQVKATGFDLSALTDTPVYAEHSQAGSQRQQTLHSHLNKLFQLANLKPSEQQLLRLLAVLPYQYYQGKQQLLPWLGLDKPAPLVELEKKGWLQRHQNAFALHPVIAHVIRQQVPLEADDLEQFANALLNAITPDETVHWSTLANTMPVLTQLINTLPAQHLTTALVQHYLATIHRATGQYAQAIPLLEQALDIWEKALGPDHPDVAQSLNNLAALHYATGDYEKALPRHQRALTICEKALGPDHPDVATSLNNLALLYDNMGDYEKALPRYQRALTIREKALGPDHPDVAQSLNNLAGLYRATGDYEKALSRYQRALTIWEKALGPDHPDVALSLNNLATLHYATGDYKKALPLCERAVSILQQVFPQGHPNLETISANLAALREEMK